MDRRSPLTAILNPTAFTEVAEGRLPEQIGRAHV